MAATKTFFKWFDLNGDGNSAITKEEALAGLTQLAGMLSYFYDEFNYYWHFFNDEQMSTVEGHGCVTEQEFTFYIEESYHITDQEILNYWINWYWTTYEINEYYFWLYYLGNGYFDWDRYYLHVPDGPAFDGKEWLVLNGDWEGGQLTQAFMWYRDNQCFFSLGAPYNEDPANSGLCTVEGHESIGYGYVLSDIIWYFDASPEHAHTFVYQLGEWGPIEAMTTERFYNGDDFWLWEKPSGHCEVCDDYDDWWYPNGIIEVPDLDLPIDEEGNYIGVIDIDIVP